MLLILPSSDRTSIGYLLQSLDGNAYNLYFFLSKLSNDLLYIDVETWLVWFSVQKKSNEIPRGFTRLFIMMQQIPNNLK